MYLVLVGGAFLVIFVISKLDFLEAAVELATLHFNIKLYYK